MINNNEKILAMQEGGHIASKVLEKLILATKEGVSTLELDNLAAKLIKEYDAEPAFLGFNKYPKNICVSINNEIVHGIPNKNIIIRQGDLVSIDLGVKYRNYITDTAATTFVGKITPKEELLIKATEEALEIVIESVKSGDRIGKIGRIISETAQKYNFKVIYELTGHGVGKKLHENPIVYNYGYDYSGEIMKDGLTIAVEPMFAIGTSEIEILQDEWTAVTQDGSKAAHFEHTLLITKDGCIVLTK